MGDSSYGPPAGYALRKNGTCSANQETCGNPWGDWYNCCPGGTHCGDNNTCCPTESGCVDFLKEDLHCANNKTWDLYQSEDSYFCCLNTTRGFLAGGLEYNGSSTTGIGCADGLPDGKDDEALVPVARGNATETSVPGSPNARNSGAESRPQTGSYAASESSTNTGAIAGGVVGGCAGLALIIALVWFLLRRRRQQAEIAPLTSSDASTTTKEKNGSYGSELEDNAIRAELQGNPNAMAHELPPTAMAHELAPNTTPHELPASPTRY